MKPRVFLVYGEVGHGHVARCHAMNAGLVKMGIPGSLVPWSQCNDIEDADLVVMDAYEAYARSWPKEWGYKVAIVDGWDVMASLRHFDFYSTSYRDRTNVCVPCVAGPRYWPVMSFAVEARRQRAQKTKIKAAVYRERIPEKWLEAIKAVGKVEILDGDLRESMESADVYIGPASQAAIEAVTQGTPAMLIETHMRLRGIALDMAGHGAIMIRDAKHLETALDALCDNGNLETMSRQCLLDHDGKGAWRLAGAIWRNYSGWKANIETCMEKRRSAWKKDGTVLQVPDNQG